MSTTTTARTRKQARPKPQRSATLGASTSGNKILWLAENGNPPRAYVLTPLASDFGAAFRLGKSDNGDGHSEEYDVCLNGTQSTCECKGFLHHRHCKHLESLAALIRAGKLSVPAPKQQQPVRELPPLEDL